MGTRERGSRGKPRRNVWYVWRDRAWPVKRDTGDQVPAVGPVDRLADAEARRVGGHQRAGRGDGDPEVGADQIQHADLRAVRHCPARTIPGRAWPRRGRLCPSRGLLVLPPWWSLCCPGGYFGEPSQTLGGESVDGLPVAVADRWLQDQVSYSPGTRMAGPPTCRPSGTARPFGSSHASWRPRAVRSR